MVDVFPDVIVAKIIKIDLIVITFYSPSFLGQETAKEPFGFRIKLHLPTFLPRTEEASHCSLLLLDVKQGSCEYQFL